MGDEIAGQGTWVLGISGNAPDDFFITKVSNGNSPILINHATEEVQFQGYRTFFTHTDAQLRMGDQTPGQGPGRSGFPGISPTISLS